jgi:hypothetical protein
MRRKVKSRGRAALQNAANGAGQFQLQMRLISERMQQTAEATVSRLGWAGFLDYR